MNGSNCYVRRFANKNMARLGNRPVVKSSVFALRADRGEKSLSLHLFSPKWDPAQWQKYQDHFTLPSGDRPGAIKVCDKDLLDCSIDLPREEVDPDDPVYGEIHYSLRALSDEEAVLLAEAVSQRAEKDGLVLEFSPRQKA